MQSVLPRVVLGQRGERIPAIQGWNSFIGDRAYKIAILFLVAPELACLALQRYLWLSFKGVGKADLEGFHIGH